MDAAGKDFPLTCSQSFQLRRTHFLGRAGGRCRTIDPSPLAFAIVRDRVDTAVIEGNRITLSRAASDGVFDPVSCQDEVVALVAPDNVHTLLFRTLLGKEEVTSTPAQKRVAAAVAVQLVGGAPSAYVVVAVRGSVARLEVIAIQNIVPLVAVQLVAALHGLDPVAMASALENIGTIGAYACSVSEAVDSFRDGYASNQQQCHPHGCQQ